MNYALLTYTRTRNFGDEIQSIAAWRLLPRLDALADRDFLNEFRPRAPTKLIVNGWFSHRPQAFGISANVDPLLISLHVNPRPRASHDGRAFTDVIRETPRIRDDLVRFGPVGARDQATADFLEGLGIPAYLSGCLTLTLERNPEAHRDDTIVLADVSDPVRRRVRALTSRPVVEERHELGKFHAPPSAFAIAERVLDIYQRAHLVVTSRLHVALPCLAFGTPVMLVRREFEDPRFDVLGTLARRFTDEEFLDLPPSRLDDPPANPDSYLRFRHGILGRVADFIGEDEPVPGRGDKDESASASVARVWRRSRPASWQGHALRWLRRSLPLRPRR
jgi:hypothetical protein